MLSCCGQSIFPVPALPPCPESRKTLGLVSCILHQIYCSLTPFSWFRDGKSRDISAWSGMFSNLAFFFTFSSGLYFPTLLTRADPRNCVGISKQKPGRLQDWCQEKLKPLPGAPGHWLGSSRQGMPSRTCVIQGVSNINIPNSHHRGRMDGLGGQDSRGNWDLQLEKLG